MHLLPAACQVPGWAWWPARVLPAPGAGQQDEDERLVLFLVDNTVARVPSQLPQFNEHYARFLQACYPNKVRIRPDQMAGAACRA
jgi:hypothetical protein